MTDATTRRTRAPSGAGGRTPGAPTRESATWAGATPREDAPSAAALMLVVEGITHFAGFEAAGISLLRGDELEAVAIAGDPALLDPKAGTVGPLRERTPTPGPATSGGSVGQGEVRVLDLHDDGGDLRGTLAVRRAEAGPLDLAQQRILEHYTAQARRAVLTALEREELSHRMSIARSSRRALRYATTRRSLESIAEECRASLQQAFRASEVWLRFVDRSPYGPPRAAGADQDPRPAVDAVLRGLEQRSWERQEPVVLTRDRPAPGLLESDEVALLAEVMDHYGVGSALLAPIGAGDECLGRLVLCRGAADRPWSAVEAESALDVGHDLGRAVLNARTWEREQQLVDRLRALDTYKTRLIATVAHELKTPLTSVLGNLELLEEGLDSEHAGFALGAAQRGAGRLARLVDDLLMLSSVTSDTDRTDWEPVNLVTLAYEVQELTAACAARAGQRVVVEAPAVPIVAHGDRRRLDHVLTNLVTNALKYSPADRTVRLRFERVGAEVLLSCVDEGIGIAASDREQLFSEFFRSADPAARSESGNGLGLSIVARIVDQHDGRVEVHSEPGAGSTFVVRLPASGPGA